MKRDSFSSAYRVTAAGAGLLILFFLGYFPPWNEHWDDLSDMLSWLELLAWVISPFAAFTGVVFLFARFSGQPRVGMATLVSAVALVAATVLLYARLLFPPAVDPANPDSFEPNLVFVFAPFYQYLVVVLCAVVGLLVGIIAKISVRKGQAG